MRKKQFGKLLTISLSDECYGMVEKIANAHQISMSAVIRDSIKYSVDQKGAWEASRPRPFDTDKAREELIDFKSSSESTKEKEGKEGEH